MACDARPEAVRVRSPCGGERRSELYALDDDPTEANNLIDAKRKVAKRLAETLDRYLQAQGQPMTEPDRIPIAPDLRKRLEALGYLEP